MKVYVEQHVGTYFDRFVALASGFLQSFQIGYVDVTSAVANETGLLKRMGDEGDAVASHADHLSQESLRQRQPVAAALLTV